jgi:uncharacterized protein
MFGISSAVKDKIIRVIHALIPEARIYLFGSRARGTYTDRSDIDIALEADKPLKRVDIGEVRDMLNASNISYKIDVVDLNSLPEEMRSAILKERVLWKE